MSDESDRLGEVHAEVSAEALLRAVIELSDDAVITCDEHGPITYCGQMKRCDRCASPPPCAAHRALSSGAHQVVECLSVRSMIPSVARSAVSEMTGKMSASFHCGSMSDQS